MELFCKKKKFFCNIHKKRPVWRHFLIKLQVSILKLHWDKGLPQRYFLVNFARYLRHLFYRTPLGDCFCCTAKYFTNKNIKEHSEKRTTTYAEQNLITIYIKSSCPVTTQKIICFLFLYFPEYIESASEIMQSHWEFIYFRK